ncbi:MAG: type II secretion system F family protein [Coriobacteriia bacterium]|nr:type II secretion system F family protein [Coriobacteriia bacterium]
MSGPYANRSTAGVASRGSTPVASPQPVHAVATDARAKGEKPKGPSLRVKSDVLVVFSRQLATMISSGITLLESLEVLAEQSTDRNLKRIVNTVIEDIRSGKDFSTALARHPKAFALMFVNMVRAGEASGQLDIILVRLAEYLESTQALKRKIKSAMTYPVISLTMILGITAFLLVGIVPKFQEIFDSLDVTLPGITQGLLVVSGVLRRHFLLGVVAATAVVIAFVVFKKTRTGGRVIDAAMLKIPVFGGLFQKVALSRFSKTFSTLIKSGIPILGALEIVAGTTGNHTVEDAVLNASSSVREGEGLSEPLSHYKVFPPMVTRMVAIGERSGALEVLLEKISEFYDQQVTAMVESLTSLIEPLLIGVMGAVVGSIVLAIFLPIFKLQEALAGSNAG